VAEEEAAKSRAQERDAEDQQLQASVLGLLQAKSASDMNTFMMAMDEEIKAQTKFISHCTQHGTQNGAGGVSQSQWLLARSLTATSMFMMT
jgi:flagellar biosynthesis chaperone FliJ